MSRYITKEVEVDVEVELEDVLEYIEYCRPDQLKRIKDFITTGEPVPKREKTSLEDSMIMEHLLNIAQSKKYSLKEIEEKLPL